MALPLSSLLNPVEEPRQPREPQAPRTAHLPSPTPSSFTPDFSPPPKKQKMTKDGAVFTRSKAKGEIRYPPCDIRDNELAREHRRFEMYPMGEIEQYPRHIPYNSDKKTFQEKTGFQYTFNVAKHEKPFLVLWDYNTGLVRMTPFFKCCNYSKTTPAKMLNMNPGLREVCHSITGGSLAAQGYWMPFEAAKAVAITFCYNIRYVLTPVFGIDFIHSCIHPNDPNFGRMVIHKDIIQQCTDEAHFYRNLYSKQPFSRESSILHSPRTPETLRCAHPRWSSKSLRPKSVRIPGSPYGYGTDSDPDDRYYVSPSYRNEWTPANTPRSASFFSTPPTRSMLTSLSTSFPTSASSITTTDSTETMSSPSSNSSGSGSGSLTPTKRRLSDADQSYHDEDDNIEISDAASDADVEDANEGTRGLEPSARRDKIQYPADSTKDAKAAYMLMKLHMADASLREEGEGLPVGASMGIVVGGRKRRGSA